MYSPAVVNHYYGGAGCGNCGGWSGASVAGAAAVGAAIGAVAARSYAVGTVYPVLPAGCAYRPYKATIEVPERLLDAATASFDNFLFGKADQ